MEWGPRALGHRSILANPANPKMKDILNEKIKKREWFRPFGVSILQEEMENYFDLKSDSPFMLLVGKVKEKQKMPFPRQFISATRAEFRQSPKKMGSFMI